MPELNRRDFIGLSAAALLAGLLCDLPAGITADLPVDLTDWRPLSPLGADGPVPAPEITAAVDVLMPADPDVPGDFTGSDYGADRVVAAALGSAGQAAMVFLLNRYARRTAGAAFMQCSDSERLDAIKAWVREREQVQPVLRDLLTGLISLSMIGTFEDNTQAEQLQVFEVMGWYDPDDPTGTFRIPNEGYVDSFQFPSRLKKGVRDD